LILWDPEDALDASGVIDRDLDVRLLVESGGRIDRLAFHEDSPDGVYWWQARLMEDCVNPPDDGAVEIAP
jgi:hypothetical protein